MSRPITLFTGQWADLPFEEVARLAGEWGYDGLEIACWGDHIDVSRWDDDEYVQSRLDVLKRNGLTAYAIANHLTGQAVCDDPIDERHRDILSDRVWGDGEPEGVRRRAAVELQNTARFAARLGVNTVTGFSGSSIWKYVAMFPPASQSMIDAGYRDFANRFNPILDVFDEVGVRFALEVHPSEIAYDYWTAKRTLDAVGNRPSLGFNFDPSHFVWQHLDSVAFVLDFADRIYHVHCKESVTNFDGRNGVLGSHLSWDNPRRGWTFVSTGHGDVPWEPLFRALNSIDYAGPTSIEWEDAGMDRPTASTL
jgi:sugar phosphate isomerase/epimerase